MNETNKENKMQKFRGIVETTGDKGFFQTFDLEEISRAKATGTMRTILRDFQEAGVTAELYEIHRADADLIVSWKIDSNLITCESFKI
jgi:hypothetical protein